MRNTACRILTGLCILLAMFALQAVAQQMPKSTKETIKNSSTATTQKMHGTVIVAEGNRLVVKMSSGELKTFDVPEGKTALIDGKPLTVDELKPGTTLEATITTTNTSLTERTTTVGTGKVFYVAGNTVILTLPNNENRMYKVQDSYRFVVDGRPATVFDLRKGMTVSAQKIVEEPRTEIASNSVVTGHAPPPPKVEVAHAPARVEPRPTPAPRPAPAPAPAAAPAPAPPPTPARVEEAPAPRLPKTGSPLHLFGVLGLLTSGSGLLLRKLR